MIFADLIGKPICEIINHMRKKKKYTLWRGLSRAEAMQLQAIEGNPLTAEEIAMFEMFDCEGWTPEQRIQHVIRLHAKPELRPVE